MRRPRHDGVGQTGRAAPFFRADRLDRTRAGPPGGGAWQDIDPSVLIRRGAIGEGTPRCDVLLGGMRHGGRAPIAVIDDGAGIDAMAQRAELRQIEEIVALLGGTLEIDSRPGEGTAVLVRLPEPQARCR